MSIFSLYVFDVSLPQTSLPWFSLFSCVHLPRPIPTPHLVTHRNVGEPTYLEKAQEFLSSLLLSSTYFDSSATDGWQALLRESAAAWGEDSVGSVTGDYFLLEAMVSASGFQVLRNHGLPGCLWSPAVLTYVYDTFLMILPSPCYLQRCQYA